MDLTFGFPVAAGPTHGYLDYGFPAYIELGIQPVPAGDEIWLGPAGHEVALPRLRWYGGQPPVVQMGATRRAEVATMLDGSRRVDLGRRIARTWTLEWDALTEGELITFLQLQRHNDRLHYYNHWDEPAWRWVIVSSLEYEPLLRVGPDGCRYRVSMRLEERTN